MAKEEQALNLRLIGVSFTEIGRQMGFGKNSPGSEHVRALQLVKAAMKRREGSFLEVLHEVRLLELARLDAMLMVHFPKQATSLESASMVLKIMERRAAYLGLDAPHESKVPYEPAPQKLPFDLRRLTDDELRQYRMLVAKITTTADAPAPAAIEQQHNPPEAASS